MNNFIYDAEGEDPNNPGILIPRYIASGRTAPNGKVYPDVTKKNEDELVLVRSIISKKDGDLSKITPDLLGKRMLRASFPDKSAIGLSFGTSFSEQTTQGLLGLKHGGHEKVSDTSGNLYAPKDCELEENGRWLVLKVGKGKSLKYPRPHNWVNVGKTSFKAGELIGSAYNSITPAYKLAATINLMKARGTYGKRYYEKDNVIVADCYAYEAGKIDYRETGSGDFEVWVGGNRYLYSPDSIYYYPQGATIKKFQRFCSGVVDMSSVAMDLGKDKIDDIFNIFRRQYYSLTSKTFNEYNSTEMFVSPDDMQEEIVELIFTGLLGVERNKDGSITSLNYLGNQGSILNRRSFFTTISYGWSGKAIQRAHRGEADLERDAMTETILGLLVNNKLDENVK